MHLRNENQDLLVCTTKGKVLESVSLSTRGKFCFVMEYGVQLCHGHRSSGLMWTEHETPTAALPNSWFMAVQYPVSQHVYRKESYTSHFPVLIFPRGAAEWSVLAQQFQTHKWCLSLREQAAPGSSSISFLEHPWVMHTKAPGALQVNDLTWAGKLCNHLI